MSRQADLRGIFDRLLTAFGPQGWWPGETPFEVIVGAVLTQNTAWANVERAIWNLKGAGALELEALHRIDAERLAELIRPSGYYNMKARRLKELVRFLVERGGIEALSKCGTEELRRALLGINGVGKETADSILLYAFNRPVFVVDAYTKRIFHRLGHLKEDAGYDDVKGFFEERLPRDAALYNEYHALIVRLGKERCRKTRPLCRGCPLSDLCPSSRNKL